MRGIASDEPPDVIVEGDKYICPTCYAHYTPPPSGVGTLRFTCHGVTVEIFKAPSTH